MSKNTCWGAYTTRQIEKCSFLWVIEMFPEMENLESPAFCAKDGTCSWKLGLSFYEEGYINSYISVLIREACEATHPAKRILVDLILMDSNSDRIESNYFTQDIDRSKVDPWEYVFKIFVKQEIVSKMNGNILKISADVTTYLQVTTDPFLQNPAAKSRDGMMSILLESKKEVDSVISIEGNLLPVHSGVLSMCSPVFKAMLHKERPGTRLRRLEIKDLPLRSFRAMIEFFYTKNVKNIDPSLAKDLLTAADKYNSEDLMTFCSVYLRSHLCSANAIDFFVSAAKSNAVELKKYCAEFIVRYRGIIKMDDEVRLALDEHNDKIMCEEGLENMFMIFAKVGKPQWLDYYSEYM